MELPQPLQSGAPLKTIVPWSRSIVNYLRAITPRSSATVNIKTFSNGTTFQVDKATSSKVNVQTQIVGLNQFKVTCRPDPEYEEEEGEQEGEQENTPRHWLVSVLGGTAKTMFGKTTLVKNVVDEPITIEASGDIEGDSDYVCFVSLVYEINYNGEEIHEFSSELDLYVGDEARENTTDVFYFPIAVVKYDGTVLQGHLGAVYLAGPRNIVELDYRTEATVPDDNEGGGE